MDLALNNLQGLIRYKNQPTKPSIKKFEQNASVFKRKRYSIINMYPPHKHCLYIILYNIVAYYIYFFE